eukprot:gene26057-20264_t
MAALPAPSQPQAETGCWPVGSQLVLHGYHHQDRKHLNGRAARVLDVEISWFGWAMRCNVDGEKKSCQPGANPIQANYKMSILSE